MSDSRLISRRTLLRGAGAAVALPWLEAMAPARALAAGTVRPPVRLGFFYVPNGVHMPNWRPKETGSKFTFPPILKSLEPHRKHVIVLSDLKADHCDGIKAAHEPAGGGYLVGYKCKHSEVPEVGGISVDQLAAKKIGARTPADSLALGIDPGFRGDHGYSGTYMSRISWRTRTAPADLELNPKQLFDRLFRGRTVRRPDWTAGGEAQDAKPSPLAGTVKGSVLDLVRDDARKLQKQLGVSDQRKLEEYLDGIRDVERRIERAGGDGRSHHKEALADELKAQDKKSPLPKLVIPDGRSIPDTFAEHVNLILDILVLAFQTDTTRIASFIFSNEKSGRSYREIGVRSSHHSISHHKGKKENHDKLTKINTHHMELFARMLRRMSDVKEGGSTLLDNVAILYGCGLSDGNKHNNDNLPTLLVGGGGGTLRGGRHVAYGKAPICNLYLEMLDRAGIKLDRFGDSTGRLGKLS